MVSDSPPAPRRRAVRAATVGTGSDRFSHSAPAARSPTSVKHRIARGRRNVLRSKEAIPINGPTYWHTVYDTKGTTGIARGLGAPLNRVNHTVVPSWGRAPTTLCT